MLLSDFDAFVQETFLQPNPSPNKQQRAWTSGSNFDTLGWGPDGNVHGSYDVGTFTTDFVTTGRCDVDGDGMWAIYSATKTLNATMVSGNNIY